MSITRGYRVRVESAEERLRREKAELRARCAEVQARCDEVSVVLGGLRGVGVSLVIPRPSGTGLDALHRWETALRDVLARAEAEYAAVKAAERRARMFDVVTSSDVVTKVSTGLASTPRISRSQAATAETAEVEWSERVEKLVDLASQVDDEALHLDVRDAARSLPQLPRQEAEAQWMRLRHRVTTSVQAEREQARVRADAAELVIRVSHLEGPAVDELKARVQSARTSRDLSDLAGDVEAMVRDAEASADADFITQEARAALSELGYQVDDPFDVVGMEAQVLLARRRDLPDHALRVQVNETQGTLMTSLVAKQGTTHAADTTAARATCADAVEMMTALEQRGVRSENRFVREPGDIEIRRELEGSVVKRTRRVRQRTQSVPVEKAISG